MLLQNLILEEQAKKYVTEFRLEMTELIHVNPQTLEERHRVFLLKKRKVDSFRDEIKIDENREIHV